MFFFLCQRAPCYKTCILHPVPTTWKWLFIGHLIFFFFSSVFSSKVQGGVQAVGQTFIHLVRSLNHVLAMNCGHLSSLLNTVVR